jgi:MFS family permease
VQTIGWHWIFWINVPVGLALIPIARLRVRESHGGHSRLDIPGVGLATTGLFGITWAVVRTNTVGWGSSEVIATLIAGLAVVGLFVLWERRTTHPMLSLAMFRQASFAAVNGISFCLFAGLFGALFLMSQFLITQTCVVLSRPGHAGHASARPRTIASPRPRPRPGRPRCRILGRTTGP